MTFGYRQYKQIATSYDTLGRVVQARSAAPKGNVTVSTAHTYFGAPEATRTILGRSDTTYTFETVHTYNINLQQTLCRYNSHAGKYHHLSPWTFCAANPIRYSDPTGMIIENPEEILKAYKEHVNSRIKELIEANKKNGKVVEYYKGWKEDLEK